MSNTSIETNNLRLTKSIFSERTCSWHTNEGVQAFFFFNIYLNLLDHRADIAVRLGGDGAHLVHTARLLGVPEHRIDNLH